MAAEPEPDYPVVDEGASYSEAVWWAYFLELFGPRDLAGSMFISWELARRFCLGLRANGTVRKVDEVDGEPLYELIPLPKGPTIHFTQTPPERATPGVYSEAQKSRQVSGMTGGASLRARRQNRSVVGRKKKL